jgi:hypothetical protein
MGSKGMTTEIKLPIESCLDCPKLKTEKVYTADSWENVESWFCKEAEKFVAKYHEWPDKKPDVPPWCPLK